MSTTTSTVIIRGQLPALRKFTDAAKGKDTMDYPVDFSLMKLLPPPAPTPEDWCDTNWGTAKEVECENFETRGNEIEYELVSEGNPPEVAIRTLSNKYPKLHFEIKFRNEDQGYYGTATYQAGMENSRFCNPIEVTL